MSHAAPFKSTYRDNIYVVEEKRGDTSLFPHTDQLPMLHRALRLEFEGRLPSRIANATARADDYRKILRHAAAYHFCLFVNTDRSDGILLFPVHTPDLIAHPAIV